MIIYKRVIIQILCLATHPANLFIIVVNYTAKGDYIRIPSAPGKGCLLAINGQTNNCIQKATGKECVWIPFY